MNDIDTRGRAAGSALLASVDELAASRPERSPLPRLAFAVIAVLAIGAGALVYAQRDDGRDSTVTSGPGAPRLIVDPVPEGFALVGAQDLDAAGSSFTITTFGDGDGADLYRDADLMVGVRSLSPDEDLTPGDSATTVPVHGTTGQVEVSDYGVVLSFQVDPGRGAFIVSRTMPVDQVVQAADRLRFDERGAVAVDGELPRGMALVGTSTMSSAGGLFELVGAGSHIARYRDTNADAAFSVVSQEGSGTLLDVQLWALRFDVRSVDVRGRRGFIGALDTGETTPYRELLFERDGGVVMIGGNLGEEQMLALAGSLRTASDDEWAASQGTESGLEIPAGSKVSMRGDLDGGSWVVYMDADGSLCASQQDSEGGSGSCSGGPTDGPQLLNDNGGTPRLVYGTSPPGAARAVLDTGVALLETQATTFGDRLLYAGGFARVPIQVVFFAADGTELARQEVTG